MRLRSAAAPHGRVPMSEIAVVGNHIELRSEDPSSKPWLARISSLRCNDEGAIQEVECEWLWHPQESLRDFSIEGADATTYGTREVFVGADAQGANDWNPVESIKWQVFVFPLDQYKELVANDFKLAESPPLEPTRCWYFRQTLDTELRRLAPPLPSAIHRPNPAYHQFCLTHGIQVSASLEKGMTAEIASEAPSRTILVPENPERQYFRCQKCLRRFETPLGDLQNPVLTSDMKHIRWKSVITQPDLDIYCPYCESVFGPLSENESNLLRSSIDAASSSPSASSLPPPSKKARVAPDSLWSEDFDSTPASSGTSVPPEKKKTRSSEGKQKQTKFERFSKIFETSISDALALGHKPFYEDTATLTETFFSRFELYSIEHQLSAKMAHQKLHEIYQNLKRENNVDLRKRVVTGEFTLDDLIRADVKDLAPESLKRKREEEQKKYFEQQVLLSAGPESLRILRKTHKGLEEVGGRSNSPDKRAQLAAANSRSFPSTEQNHEGDGTVFNSTAITDSLKDIVRNCILKSQHPLATTCPFPLIEEWRWVPQALRCDPQMSSISFPFGVPDRDQSRQLLLERLANNCEKISAEVIRYASDPSYSRPPLGQRPLVQ